jgi:hypothetical protein
MVTGLLLTVGVMTGRVGKMLDPGGGSVGSHYKIRSRTVSSLVAEYLVEGMR